MSRSSGTKRDIQDMVGGASAGSEWQVDCAGWDDSAHTNIYAFTHYHARPLP
jgi:uncharacterized protein YjlB